MDSNQEKGKKCEDLWEPILHSICPSLEPLKKGADFKCGNTFFEIKSCRSGLTKKQQEMKSKIEERGDKYLILRCPCEEPNKQK